MSDQRDQPPLPFDPALTPEKPRASTEPPHEVSVDVFANLLFQELARRSAAVREREQRSA